MKSAVWTLFRPSHSISFRILLFGPVVGLLQGLLKINESFDLAAATGLATVVAIGVGGWLGTHLGILALQFWGRWTTSMANRLEALEEKLNAVVPFVSEEETGSSTSSRKYFSFSLLVHVSLGLLIMLPVSGIHALIDLATNISPNSYWVPVAKANFGLALLCIALQIFVFWSLERRIARMEDILDSAVRLVSITRQAQHWNHSVRKAQSHVEQVTGLPVPAPA